MIAYQFNDGVSFTSRIPSPGAEDPLSGQPSVFGYVNPMAALLNGTGSTLSVLEMEGRLITKLDRVWGERVRLVRTVDFRDDLRGFARRVALDLASPKDTPPEVMQFLASGQNREYAVAALKAMASEPCEDPSKAWPPSIPLILLMVVLQYSSMEPCVLAQHAILDASFVHPDHTAFAKFGEWLAELAQLKLNPALNENSIP